MSETLLSSRNLAFELYEVLDAEGLPQRERFAEHSRETFDAASWNGKTPSERTRILFRAADLIEQCADELAAIDSRNVGMSLAERTRLHAQGVRA